VKEKLLGSGVGVKALVKIAWVVPLSFPTRVKDQFWTLTCSIKTPQVHSARGREGGLAPAMSDMLQLVAKD